MFSGLWIEFIASDNYVVSYFSIRQSQLPLMLLPSNMQIHSESGKGQFEIVLGYTDAITQADNLVYTHEIIKGIARKHGLLATFMPK